MKLLMAVVDAMLPYFRTLRQSELNDFTRN